MPSGIIMPSVGKICTQCRPKKMEKCPLECEPLVAPWKAAAASDGGNGDEAMENLNNMVEVMRFVRHMDVADRTGHNGSTSKGKEGGRKRNRKLGGRTRLHRNVEKANAVLAYWSTQDEWRENWSWPQERCDDIIVRALNYFEKKNVVCLGASGSEP